MRLRPTTPEPQKGSATRLVTGYPAPSIADCDDYYPFGELISCGGTATLRFKFTGQERDNETLLDNFKARYVSSAMGRFMNPDPSGISLADLNDPQQLNLYSYVRNNPADMTDPTGLDPGFCGIEGDEYPCGFGENCWDYDILSCWHDFQQPPELAPLSPFAANPASSFIATGPGTDWQTILFGPPNPSLLIINNFGGFPPLVDPASIFGSICPAGGGTIGEAASNCVPPLSFLRFSGYEWPYPHDDFANLMRYKPHRSLSERAATYFSQYVPCAFAGMIHYSIGNEENAKKFFVLNAVVPPISFLKWGPWGLALGSTGAAAYDLHAAVNINVACTAQVYGGQ